MYYAIFALAFAAGFLAGERAAYRSLCYFSEAAFSSLRYWGRFFNVNWMPRVKVRLSK